MLIHRQRRVLLIILFIAYCGVSSGQLHSEQTYLTNAIGAVSDNLRLLASPVQQAITTNNVASTCVFYRGCPSYANFGVYDDGGLAPLNSSYNFGTTAVNLTRMVHQPFASNNGSSQYACWSQQMLSAAAQNLQTHRNYTSYQYITWNNGQLDSYPAENWTASYGCPSDSFDPRTRSWYISAMVPPLNLIVLISTRDCAAGCLAQNKAFTVAFLQRLSYWNFVSIVVYDSFVSLQLPLRRATSAVVADAVDTVNSLNATQTGVADVSSAMKTAGTILASASVTRADAVLLWISDGQNDYSLLDPVSALISTASSAGTLVPHVFSVLIGRNATTTSLALPRRFACETNSIFVSVAVTGSVSDAVQQIFSTIAAGVSTDTVRPSQPYVDEASGLDTVSLGLVLYQTSANGVRLPLGVVTTDVTTAYLTNDGQISRDNLTTFLLDNQVFTQISIPAAVIAAATGDANVCIPLPTASQFVDPQWVTLFGLWVVVSVLGIFLVVGLTMCIARAVLHVKASARKTMPCYFILAVTSLAVGWALLWPQYVRSATFKEARFVVVQHDDNPYRCCDIVACSCVEASALPSCSSLLISLTPGLCGNGYYCCEESCYDCGCYESCYEYRRRRLLLQEDLPSENSANSAENSAMSSASSAENSAANSLSSAVFRPHPANVSAAHHHMMESMIGHRAPVHRAQSCTTHCSRCCYCVSSVSQRLCQVACGTCYRPAVTVRYFNPLQAMDVNVTMTIACSRDDYACVSAYYATFPPLGGAFTGYYNPHNPQDIATDRSLLSVNMVAFIFVVVFLSFIVLPLLILVVPLLVKCISNLDCHCHCHCDSHCDSCGDRKATTPSKDLAMVDIQTAAPPPTTLNEVQKEEQIAHTIAIAQPIAVPPPLWEGKSDTVPSATVSDAHENS